MIACAPLYEPRCPNCGRKLAMKVEGRVEMYCPRCKRFCVFTSSDLTERLDRAIMEQAKVGTPT